MGLQDGRIVVLVQKAHFEYINFTFYKKIYYSFYNNILMKIKEV